MSEHNVDVVEAVEQQLLTEDQQTRIVQQVVQSWNNGKQARADKEQDWLQCWRAYLMSRDNTKSRKEKEAWRSKVVPSWIYEVVEAGVDEVMEYMFPNDTDNFSYEPKTPGDPMQDANAKLMSSHVQMQLEDDDFIDTVRMHLQQSAIIGPSVLKVMWDSQYDMVPVARSIDPYSGQPLVQRELKAVKDGPHVECVPMFDFVVWPVNTDLRRSMQIHRVYRDLHSIQNNPSYNNTEQVKPEILPPNKSDINGNLKQQINMAHGLTEQNKELPETEKFVQLYEAWGDFYIDGVCYHNYVATVANEKVLLRFSPNPFDYGVKPFVFNNWREIHNQFYGMGMVKPAVDKFLIGTKVTNMIMDEAVLKIHGQYKYVPDGVFDPSMFIVGPGFCHAVGDIDNLQAVNPNLSLGIGFQERNNIKSEIESATGVTQFSKGAETSYKTRTARESVLMARGGSKRFATLAKYFNRKCVKKVLEIVYLLNYRFEDVQKMMMLHGVQNVSVLASQLPLDRIFVKVTGIETMLNKETKLESLERGVFNVINTPAGMMLNTPAILKEYFDLLGFQASERFLLPDPLLQMLFQMQLMRMMGPALGAQQPSDAASEDKQPADESNISTPLP